MKTRVKKFTDDETGIVLKSLDTVGIISKITPMTEKENKRRSVYEVLYG